MKPLYTAKKPVGQFHHSWKKTTNFGRELLENTLTIKIAMTETMLGRVSVHGVESLWVD